MALETRYDVSTHVDSSALADKFPEICGNATLAMEVSSTSMNVTIVTIIAITQGLIDPSGIRNLASNLSFTLRLRIRSCVKILTTFPCALFHAYGYLVIAVATTFIPGRKIALSGGIGSSTIFTGTR